MIPKKNNNNIRLSAWLFGVVLLSGCSSMSTDTDEEANTSILGEEALATPQDRGLRATFDYFFGDPPPPPSREVLQQFNIPAALVQLGEFPQSAMLRAVSTPYGDLWYAGPQAMVLAHGRVIASGDAVPADVIAVTNQTADPLYCLTHTAPSQSASNCPMQWQREVDIRPSRNDDGNYTRGNIIYTYQVDSSFRQQGDVLIETGVATNAVGDTYDFENQFTLSNGRVMAARQWLSPEMGYLDYEIVAMPAGTDSQVNYRADGLNIEVQSGVRMSLLLENAQVAPLLSTTHYWPLLRVHNDELQSKLEARREGMRMRLRMLREYYLTDGNTELAAAASTLLNEFERWPLRATYVHGLQPPQMLINFADNPYLNPADAGASGQYAVSLPMRPSGSRVLGLTDTVFSMPAIYDVQPNGSIQRRDAPDAMLLPIAGQATLRLQSIPDAMLPPGFRDLNYQLALFLQHWNWAVAFADTAQTGDAS